MTNQDIHEIEIVAVCRIKDCELENARLIIEDTNMFEARLTGIRNARYENVLLLDSDQLPEQGLLEELENIGSDMAIIPERSIYHSFVASCLDDKRERMEKYAYRLPSPYIPAIPRYYKRELLMKAMNVLPPNISKIEAHEDSILYYGAFKLSQNIKFSIKHIYNNDPKFSTIMRKTLLYGKYKKISDSSSLSPEFLMLFKELNRNALNIKELGVGKWLPLQILRAIFYFIGSIIG